MGRDQTLTVPVLVCEALGLGSDDGDEECYKIISALPFGISLGYSPTEQVSAVLYCEGSLPEKETPLPSTGPSQNTLKSTGAKGGAPQGGRAFSQEHTLTTLGLTA